MNSEGDERKVREERREAITHRCQVGRVGIYRRLDL